MQEKREQELRQRQHQQPEEQHINIAPRTTAPSPSDALVEGFMGEGPRVSNVVCGVDLDCRLDTHYIARAAMHYKIGADKRGEGKIRLPAAILRIREPVRSTALVFRTGKMQVLGTKSVEDAHLAARKFARIIVKMGFRAKVGAAVRVQNVVASADMKMVLHLEGIQRDHGRFARYEPELFPGLSYRMVKPKVTFLVFVRGKVVIVGAKKVEDIHEAWGKFWPMLVQYRKG